MKSLLMILLVSVKFTAGSPESDHYCGLIQDYAKSHYPRTNFRQFVFVSIKHQQLFYIEEGKAKLVFSVSTAKKGFGFTYNSEQTPTGLHCIKGCIGNATPSGGVIDKNGFTGKKAEIVSEAISTGKDIITTRAYRLDGMENGKNKGGKVDSYSRDIMLHGTHEEGLIGKPASHGCIRMRNEDILMLEPLLKDGLPVLILHY
ncbi:MAG TPA: hypothetical protein DEP18_03615 [Flavobacteriales bacterium]|nr:hypothetical protein [Flavobacteriales bacterium]HRE73339.1 L,D-transpeptidase [Flavobacteriales bacterium]HRJ39207.1 L,D-transpeptidase [Flavobacteriales bacterium]